MVVPIFPSRASKALYFMIMLHHFIDSNSLVGTSSIESDKLESGINSGRYLVFPTPSTTGAATKVQLIMGLGLPMEVGVSTIIGYVLKFNYALPYNASYLTHPYGARYDRSIDPCSISGCGDKEDEDDEEEGVATEWAGEKSRGGSTSRWQMYRVIETALDSFQVSGKGCLLKIVCQVAQVPFENSHAGLVSQLIRLLLTPSMTREKYQVLGDQEYHSAEAAGRNNRDNCERLFPECRHDLLEYFTEIDEAEEEPEEPHDISR